MSETMKLLWNADLKLNTVHVKDLCRAMWFVCQRDDTLNQVYNVVDDCDATQGTITEIVSDMYKINFDYYGNTLSNIVKVIEFFFHIRNFLYFYIKRFYKSLILLIWSDFKNLSAIRR